MLESALAISRPSELESRCEMWIVVAGWLAALLVFSSFFMKTIVPLRIVAMVSNVVFIVYALLGLAYGVFGRVYPILVLHSCLLPLNVLRMRQLRALIRAVGRLQNSMLKKGPGTAISLAEQATTRVNKRSTMPRQSTRKHASRFGSTARSDQRPRAATRA